MKLFGITGGIGMGKSTTARLLVDKGVAVIDTDQLARHLVEPGQSALQDITDAFGLGMVDSTGRLRRDELARVVFSDEKARVRLEGILHPRIRAVWRAEADRWRAAGHATGAVIIPLLFETQAEREFDCIICVACQEATQRRRLAERGWSPEEINRRIASQWPVNRKIDRSHRVIWTEPSVAVHAAQLDRILGESTIG